MQQIGVFATTERQFYAGKIVGIQALGVRKIWNGFQSLIPSSQASVVSDADEPSRIIRRGVATASTVELL